jgi:peptidoglycan hydrolase CwlO-like protein
MRRLLAPILFAALFVGAPSAGGQDEGSLRDQISKGKRVETSLAGAAARLGRLERAVAREVGILEARVAGAQADLDRAQALADRTARELDAARARVARLRMRLGEVRTQLGANLRERYMGSKPDLVTVVLEARGFAELLETVAFLKTIQRRNTELLALVRSARRDAGREKRVLTRLAAQRRAAEAAVRRRRDGLAQMAAVLRGRRDALAQARAARLEALSSVRARRRAAEKVLTKLIAERERAALIPGPGGPWAIPWPIVQCESGGQNYPPNYASASGYYQITDATWAGLGGSTKHAYQASKAEQDRLAAKLWAGGAGARNWVCAALVGVI